MSPSPTIEEKIAHYQPSAETKALLQSTPMLALVGISGAGKDTIRRRLIETGDYHSFVSHTTRLPRTNHGVMERDGVEYHFIDLNAAEQMLDSGAYIEAKIYSGNIYGTSVSELQAAKASGKIAIADIEVQGIAEYMKIAPNTKAVFLLPPSFEAWKQRLMGRYENGQIDQVDLQRRYNTSIFELECGLKNDYFHFVVNDDLDDAIAQVAAIAHSSNEPKREADALALAEQLLQDIRSHSL